MPFHYSTPESKFATKIGLDPQLDLRQACSDFYVLERLVSSGMKEAKPVLSALESRLAPEFSVYIDMALGGELRHARRRRGSYAYDTDPCFDCSCRSLSAPRPCDGCRHGNKCCCIHCTGGCDCWYIDATVSVPPPLDKFLDLLDKKPKTKAMNSRTVGWKEWLAFRKESGLEVLDLAIRVFQSDEWSNGFGGRPWATIGRVLRDFNTGVLHPRTFLDRCWTLEHNGGNVFNKLYSDAPELGSALQRQADNDYNYLAHYASGSVKHLWHLHKARLRDAYGMDSAWLGVQPTHTWEV